MGKGKDNWSSLTPDLIRSAAKSAASLTFFGSVSTVGSSVGSSTTGSGSGSSMTGIGYSTVTSTTGAGGTQGSREGSTVTVNRVSEGGTISM